LAAFSADFVTENPLNMIGQVNLRKLTLASSLLSLLDGLDDTDGNSLPHVTNGETTKRRVFIVGFNTLKGIY
jgi:hypothetical protein